MYIFIEAVTGLTIRMQVEEADYISTIKQRLMLGEDILVEDQNLIFQYEDLKDNKQLKDYQIKNGSVIKLVLKMRGGPVSPDIVYDEDVVSTSHISDRLVYLILENIVQIPNTEFQNIKSHVDDNVHLSKDDIHSTLTNQERNNKMEILRLKMDRIRLDKRISSKYGQTQSSESSISTSNHLSHSKLISPTFKPNINNSSDNNQKNNNSNSNFQRSISLDARSTSIIPGMANLLQIQTIPTKSERSPRLGLHRTLSVLDTMKIHKAYPTRVQQLRDLEQNKQTLRRYAESFNCTHNHQRSNNTNNNTNINSSASSHHSNLVNNSKRSVLPPLNETEQEHKRQYKQSANSKPRCFVCNKKLSLALEFNCRCSGKFCSKHRYPEEHKCTFDYKAAGQLHLTKNNPVIIAEKIAKI